MLEQVNIQMQKQNFKRTLGNSSKVSQKLIIVAMTVSQEIVPGQWGEISKNKKSRKRPDMLSRITQAAS